jgi:hypothetical protein
MQSIDDKQLSRKADTMEIVVETDPALMEQAIVDLARACEEEIARSDRPTDAFPLKAIVALFLVNKQHLAGWEKQVPEEVLTALQQLRVRCFLCPAEEAQLQNKFYALPHAELVRFRESTPILKIVSAFRFDYEFHVGGRVKNVTETKIREALEFEVFARDIEIGALLSARSRMTTSPIVASKGSGLDHLRQCAWIEGVPSKGEAVHAELCGDRRLALIESLRWEGQKLAVKFVPTAASAAQVESAIVAQVDRWSGVGRTAAEYEEALAGPAASVRILMKACAHVTKAAETKHAVAKATKKADLRAAARAKKQAICLEKGIRWRDRAAPAADPMTKAQHEYLSHGDFSPFELAFVAHAADVDPNLISIEHVLATPLFTIARMLRRLYTRRQLRPEFAELDALSDLIFATHGKPVLYPVAREFVARAAFDLAPRECWQAWFDNPLLPLL